MGHLVFLGLLAYPRPSEINHFCNFVLSVFSEKWKALSEGNFIKRSRIDRRFREYPKRKALRNINHTFKRIEKRMQAVIIALNVMNKWEPNVNKSVEHFMDKQGYLLDIYQEDTNIYKSIWTNSKSVLHMALALFPLLKKIPSSLSDKTPEVLSIELLDDLKSKRTKEVEKILKKEVVIPLEDLFLLSNEVRKKHNIGDEIYLISTGRWLPEILKVAEAWYILLPKLIPTIKRENLYKIF